MWTKRNVRKLASEGNNMASTRPNHRLTVAAEESELRLASWHYGKSR